MRGVVEHRKNLEKKHYFSIITENQNCDFRFAFRFNNEKKTKTIQNSILF